jgi:catechol 2,3-dioxygenase-like lactoylglutathione lyase family enzyme
MMQSQLAAVTYDTQNPARHAQFWAALLEREPIEDADGVLLPGTDGQLDLRFAADDAPPQSRHRMHLHLTSTSLLDQQHTVATAVELGASHLDVGQRPEEGHIVLSDPGGYEFCVIEPDNGYLAGCGRLGELSCDGTHEVGIFWSRVLGWPLVWDKGEETAVQLPQGGTKVSWDAWDGEPVSSRQGGDRQRFELVATGGDLDTEVNRLVGLGARRLRTTSRGAILLADPNGTEFRLHAH